MKILDSFTGEHEFLSNFYPATVYFAGLVYPTVEHAFQAGKTHDPAAREQIRTAFSPSVAKRLGRAVALRPDWESWKFELMENLVANKFRDTALAERLLATGNAVLIEGNTWHDQIWGNCTCPQHHPEFGRNALGIVLMKVRLHLLARR